MINERKCCGTFEGTPHRKTCIPNLLKEIDEAQKEIRVLTRQMKAHKDCDDLERQLAEARAEVAMKEVD